MYKFVPYGSVLAHDTIRKSSTIVVTCVSTGILPLPGYHFVFGLYVHAQAI